jgi:hypothetical protein
LRYSLNGWVASPRKTKKIKRGQSRRTTHEEIPKVVSTPLKKEKVWKKRSSEIHHHTTKVKQNGVET